VLVVEGYMDVVGLAQFGVGNAVATLGTAATPHHIQKLLRLTDRVVFCFDGDAAGRRAAGRALEVSLEHLADNKTLSFLFLPEEHDPDSFVRAEGPDAFRAAMNRALPLAEFLLAELKKDIDLGTAEGCARLVHEAKPLVTRIAAPLLRLQVIKMLAEAAGFTQAEVEQSFGLKAGRRPLRRQPPFEGDFKGGATSARPPGPATPAAWLPRLRRAGAADRSRLLKLVIQHPVWAARLPIDLLPDDSPEGLALRAIVDALSVGDLPTHGIGALLEHYRGSPTPKPSTAWPASSPTAPSTRRRLNPCSTTHSRSWKDAVSREIDALNARERETG
jgi:DNA primase